jgi:hypothetical protein
MLASRFHRFAWAIAAVVPCLAAAEGQNVHRCIGEHGEISFSGTPCAGGPTGIQPASSPTTSPSSPGERRSVAPTCPASTGALRDVIAEAFARRDANTIAGVMRWDGVGGAAARERMRELAELTGHPLLGIDLDDGGAAADSAESQPPQATLLTVHIGSLEGGASEHEFRLMPVGGCYWLDW